jgi:tetratricopeptide (TPR) repeat protein
MSDDPQSAASRARRPSHASPEVPSTPEAPEPLTEEALPHQGQEEQDPYGAGEAYGSPQDYETPPEGEAQGYDETPAYEEPPAAYEETLEAPPAEPEIPAAQSIAPRPLLRRLQKRAVAAESADVDDEMLLLSARLQELIARKSGSNESAPPVSAASAAPPAAKVRQYFKPSGQTPPPPQPPQPSQSPQTSQPAAPRSEHRSAYHPPLPSAPSLTPPGPPKPRPAYRPVPNEPVSKPSWKKRLALIVAVLLLSVGSYLGGRQAASEANAARAARAADMPVQSEETTLSEAEKAEIDKLLATDQEGELEAAFKLAENLKSKRKLGDRLNLYLANLNFRSKKFNDGEALLKAAAERSGLPTGLSRGFGTARQRNFDRALRWFAQATQEAPFSADGFYLMGETLRRKGNLKEAVEQFRLALLRPTTGVNPEESRELIKFKLGLTQIELGNVAELQSEIDARLRRPPNSGYVLLTQAALALQSNNIAEAITWLNKAQSALGAERFKGLMADYFFRSYASQRELSDFFQPDADFAKKTLLSPTVYFIDP